MILYRLKLKLDGSYYQTEIKFPGQVTTSEIWSKKSLYNFFVNNSVGHLQFINDVYIIERENTRTNKLKQFKITKFFNFFKENINEY